MTSDFDNVMPGHLGYLTPPQEATLAKLKEELSAAGVYDPAQTDDPSLLRFLRARNFDLAKTKAMYTNTARWKKEFGVDELYHTFEYTEKAQVDKYYPRFCHQVDNGGRPVSIERFGNLDVAKLFAVTTKDRQLQALVFEYETLLRHRMPICSQVAGRPIETTCSIIDIKDVGLSTFLKNRAYIQELISNHYPEMVHKLYVINTPWIGATIWSYVKNWIAPETAAKVEILGSDYAATLLKDIPKANLPSYLGGTCVCEGGCSLSDIGPWKGKPAPSGSAGVESDDGERRSVPSKAAVQSQTE